MKTNTKTKIQIKIKTVQNTLDEWTWERITPSTIYANNIAEDLENFIKVYNQTHEGVERINEIRWNYDGYMQGNYISAGQEIFEYTFKLWREKHPVSNLA